MEIFDYDNILLLPRKCVVDSRSECDTSMEFGPRRFKLPEAAGAANAVEPLYGLRWPENAHVENLVATAWVENADGRIVQMASDRCADPK